MDDVSQLGERVPVGVQVGLSLVVLGVVGGVGRNGEHEQVVEVGWEIVEIDVLRVVVAILGVEL